MPNFHDMNVQKVGKMSKKKRKNNKKSRSPGLISQMFSNNMPQQQMESSFNSSNKPHNEWSMLEDMIQNAGTPTTETGEALDIDLDKCLDFSVRFGSGKFPAKKNAGLLPLLLNIKETNFDELDIEIDSKIDLVCVIDISGSMSGAKIDYVRQTMHGLLEVLGNGHRISIVLFDNEAEEYMNFKVINEENKPKIKEIIDSITHRGATNITAGVHMAQTMLGNRETKNHVSCVFLLSDGSHNSGPISMDILYNNDIQRTKCEYTLTCFGYGDDHDANLLQEMSEQKGGNYYFVNDITKIEDCFLDCLGMVTSVLGQNIVVNFALTPTPVVPEIRFHKTFGPYWNSISPIKNQVKISSFYSGFNKNFLAQLNLDPIRTGDITEETEIVIGEVTLTIDTIQTPKVTKTYKTQLKLTLVPESFNGDLQEDVNVQKQLTRVKGADIIDLAQELENNGKYDEAMKVIETFNKDLEQKSFCKEELFTNMNKSLKKQKDMINNTKNGRKNAFKTLNYAKQSKNIYMNECSAPMFSKGLYQNKKQKKMSSKY